MTDYSDNGWETNVEPELYDRLAKGEDVRFPPMGRPFYGAPHEGTVAFVPLNTGDIIKMVPRGKTGSLRVTVTTWHSTQRGKGTRRIRRDYHYTFRAISESQEQRPR